MIVFPLLMSRRFSGGDDPHPISALRKDGRQQDAVRHPSDYIAQFTMRLAGIQPLQSERVTEDKARCLECDGVFLEIPPSF